MANEIREVFIGSSREGQKYAEELQKGLNTELIRYGLYCTLWKDPGTFILSHVTIENLYRKAIELSCSDGYAVMLVTPDDKIQIRNEIRYVPRDNVIFELGLFMGKLGRERTFCVIPSNVNIKMMSDWAGVTNATYKYQKRPKKTDILQFLSGSIQAIRLSIESIERPRTIVNSIKDAKVNPNVDNTSNIKNVLKEIECNFGTQDKYLKRRKF